MLVIKHTWKEIAMTWCFLEKPLDQKQTCCHFAVQVFSYSDKLQIFEHTYSVEA